MGATGNAFIARVWTGGVGNSPQLVVPITNLGFISITDWAGGAVPAPFNGSQDCNVAGGLLPGNSYHFYYTFEPTAKGSFSAISNFSTNAGTFKVELHGGGLPSVFLPLIGR